MKQQREAVSSMDMTEAAESFGYRYTALSPDAAADEDRLPLFKGLVGLQHLPCGIGLCASDWECLRDSEHDGIVSRSLIIALTLDGDTASCTFGRRNRLQFAPGSGAVVSVADSARLAARIRAGQRSRSLLIRTRPQDLGDDDVAEKVEALLRSTSIAPIQLAPHASHLARELFQPTAVGGIGRMLAESCALQFLARALSGNGSEETMSTDRVSPRDRAKVLQVRDRLLAEPEGDHTLCDLARDAGLSVSALKAKFPQVLGQPVFGFLRDARLQRAHDGIALEGWTVSQAAYLVGYRHQSNFSIAFRRKFGVAPSEVRRR